MHLDPSFVVLSAVLVSLATVSTDNITVNAGLIAGQRIAKSAGSMPLRDAQTPPSTERTWPIHSDWNNSGDILGRRIEADELFARLDGQSITMPHGAWFIEIQSIVEEAGFRWMQLTLTGHDAGAANRTGCAPSGP